MTLTDLRKLSLSDRDRMAAEQVMGWQKDDDAWTVDASRIVIWADRYHPSRDLNQAHELEQRVIGRWGEDDWFDAMCKVIPDLGCQCKIRATAEQRVLACLLAVGGGE